MGILSFVSLEGTCLLPGGSSFFISLQLGLIFILLYCYKYKIFLYFRGECVQCSFLRGTQPKPDFPHPQLQHRTSSDWGHGQDFQGWAQIIGNKLLDVLKSAKPAQSSSGQGKSQPLGQHKTKVTLWIMAKIQFIGVNSLTPGPAPKAADCWFRLQRSLRM